MAQLTDIDILSAVKKGNINKYEILVKKYMKIIYSLVAKQLFNKLDIEDIVQVVFVKFYKNIERFDEKRPVLPYLYQIAKNELKMYYRSHKELRLSDSLEIADNRKIEFNIDDLDTILKELPPEQKDIIQMVYDGFSYSEIAEKIQKPLNTVKTIVRRARIKIIHTYYGKKT